MTETTQQDMYIDSKELVFNKNNDIQSGGFSVTDIMNKAGISPIMMMNVNTHLQSGGGSDKVSDLFQHLAVPSWATMYNMRGGEYKRKGCDKDDSDSDGDIDDDLHDKLLELVKDHEHKLKSKPKKSKRNNKNEKKNTTKKIKNKK